MKYALLALMLGALVAAAAPEAAPDHPRFAQVADPILDNILAALEKGEHAAYVQDFAPVMKRVSAEATFVTVRRQILNTVGKCKSREPLGVLNQDGQEVFLWKARFEKTEDDVLIKLVISEFEGKALVTGLWFDWGK